MKRRYFLSAGARLIGAGLLLPPARLLDVAHADTPAEAGAADPPDLVLARGEPRSAVAAALAAVGGMERFVKPDQVVIVKPNASFPRPPELGATTHPDVLSAVIDACLGAGARRVLVVDHTMSDPQRCFQINGTEAAVAAFTKAKLVSLDKEKTYRPVAVPAGKALHETAIPAAVQKADVLINLPTAKSHSATGVSFGIKNLMGLIWNRECFHQDMDLHQGVADLATVLKPQLTILDAAVILKTGGPQGPGQTDPFGGVVVGTDPVAVDAYGTGLATWNSMTLRPEQVAYLRYAAEHGLGTLDLTSLRVEELG